MVVLTPHQALRRRAIACLARREHSRAELAQKLAARFEADSGEIDAVLDELVAQGLQSDQRFAESWVRSKAARFGSARLRHDLLAKGVAAELVEAVLAEAISGEESKEGDEATRARALWQHRFGQPATDVRERAKQARFLQGRGFSSAVIGTLLREVARA